MKHEKEKPVLYTHTHGKSDYETQEKNDIKNLYLHVIMLSRHIYVTIHMLQATNNQQQIVTKQ